jgi:hypothetical protein
MQFKDLGNQEGKENSDRINQKFNYYYFCADCLMSLPNHYSLPS